MLPIASRKQPNEEVTCMRRLFSSPLSPYAAKARIALYEKGLEFEKINVLWDPVRGFAEKPGEMLAINPKGPIQPPDRGKVIAIPQVGGLHQRYERLAA